MEGWGRLQPWDYGNPATGPPPLPDPGRGSEDLQLHLHRHLCLGVSVQTCGLRLPPVLPGQVTAERGLGEWRVSRDVSPGGNSQKAFEPEDLS